MSDLRIITMVGRSVYHKGEEGEFATLCGLSIIAHRGSVRSPHTTDESMIFVGKRLCRRCMRAIEAREDVGDLTDEE